MQIDKTLRVLMFQGEGCLIGQCLEYDICTQGSTAEELRERMECLIQIEIEEAHQSGQTLDAAPERFHNMWDDVSEIENGNHQYGLVAAA